MIAVADHFNMHDFKNNLFDFVISEFTALDHLDASRLEWLILLSDLLSLELFDETGLEANLAKSSLPGFLTALLDQVLLNPQLLHLTRKCFLVKQVSRWLFRSDGRCSGVLKSLALQGFVHERVSVWVEILFRLRVDESLELPLKLNLRISSKTLNSLALL